MAALREQARLERRFVALKFMKKILKNQIKFGCANFDGFFPILI
jgi:hypothetical protein